MPEGLNTFNDPDSSPPLSRYERQSAVAYVTNAAAGAALREGLAEWLPEIEVRRGNGIREAIVVHKSAPSPDILIVDVDQEEDPLAALDNLSSVVTPDTDVLVVGNACRTKDRSTHDLALYRKITRDLGVAEYLPEPLTPELVRHHFGPLVRGHAFPGERNRGGRLIVVTGVRGGVGASVIAASLAWHCSEARRHTVLLDGDIVRGTAALLLDAAPGEGLRLALKDPERIDALLAERAATPAGERLHVLAARQHPGEAPRYAPGGCERLLAALRQRYGFIIADVPWTGDPFCRDLFDAAHHRVLVLTPTLPAARDGQALRSLTGANGRPTPTTLVLNRVNMPGGLKRAQLESALGHPIQVALPDLPHQIGNFVTLGEPTKVSSFENGIAAIAGQVGVIRQESAAKPGRQPWRLFGRR